VKLKGLLFAAALGAALSSSIGAQAQQARTLKMQSSWPAGIAAQDHFRIFADRLDKISSGSLKIEVMSAGQIVPAFEVLDAASKKVIDGFHSIPYYWVNKNRAAVLFAGPPGGPFGMDHTDYLGWMWEGGGHEMWIELYQKELKLNLMPFSAHPTSPQAFGWFKRPVKNLKDFKGMKCRQTGITAEVFQRMGMNVVNMPGGEIIPAAQRGTIDCAEWVGGKDDLNLGFQSVWKYHYVPGMHESTSTGEIIFNKDVWDSFSAPHQEIIKSVANESFARWWPRWQKGQAEAMKELQEKHGVQILRTPPDILIAFLKTWDEVLAEESAKNPFFKKVIDSQRQYASVVVPAKRFLFPPYSFAANYYWPEKKPAARADKK